MKEIMKYIHDDDKLEEIRDAYFRLPGEGRVRAIEALKEIRDESAGRFLNAILPGETDKKIRKVIKKGIFRLKTMGIRVDEPRSGGESVLRKILEKREHKGFMSTYDKEGTRIVVAAFEVKRDSYLFVNAITHWSDGLMDLKLAPVTKQDYDTIITQYQADTTKSIVFVDISACYAAHLIEEADARSHRYPEDVRHMKQFAGALTDEIQGPRDLYGLSIPGETKPLSVADLLLHDIFAPFTVTWDSMETDRKALADLGSSTIVLPARLVEEKRQTFLRTLLDNEALTARIPLMKRVLEDYAYVFYRTGQMDYFKGLIDLLKAEKGPHVALAFFAGRTLEPAEKRTEPQPGLIVNPYDQIRR
jgi:hypothetical protein